MFIETQFGVVLNSDLITSYTIFQLFYSSKYRFTVNLADKRAYTVCTDTKDVEKLKKIRDDLLSSVMSGKTYWKFKE